MALLERITLDAEKDIIEENIEQPDSEVLGVLPIHLQVALNPKLALNPKPQTLNPKP